jgi:hypothetical protein
MPVGLDAAKLAATHGACKEIDMEISLTKNVIKGVCEVAGPQVTFTLADAGQANVAIHVALSDGTHFAFPDGTGPQVQASTVLPPGEYSCSVLIAAFSHGAFGTSYASTVSVGGRKVATTQGDVADGSDEEDDSRSFTLRIV